MNRPRILAIATVLLFALSAVAQHASARSALALRVSSHILGTVQGTSQEDPHNADGHGANAAENAVPTVESQMKLFTDKLELTAEQEAKLKPVLDDLHDATLKLVQNDRMSNEERMNNMRMWRMKTDKRIREFLSDEQKKKLDQVEHEPHPELHGDVDRALTPR